MYNSNIIQFALERNAYYISENKTRFHARITREIKNKFNIKIWVNTIKKWISSTNTLKNRHIREYLKDKRGQIISTFYTRHSKIKLINMEIVGKFIELYPFSTRQDIKTLIYNDFNINISIGVISKILKKNNFTRKVVRKHVVKNKDFLDNLSQERKIFINEIHKKYFKHIIYIDESGFTNQIPLKGLSKKGKQININIKALREQRLNLIMGITSCLMIDYQIYDCTINNSIFYSFIELIINKLKENFDNISYTFIYDNVSFHKMSNIEKIIKDNNHNILKLPPYSPNLNPIENIFGILKEIYKKNNKNNYYNYSKKNNIEIINNSILEFVTIYTINLKEICDRSYKYSYENLEKELRDRLIIQN